MTNTKQAVKMPDKYEFLNWGDLLEITTIGMWGHDAYTRTYAFSGARGHYQETEYRFSQCGDASISKDAYSDVHFKAKECRIGFSNGVYKIKSIIRADLAETVPTVVTDDIIRLGVRIIKSLSKTRIPEYDLPADSFLEEAVIKILSLRIVP